MHTEKIRILLAEDDHNLGTILCAYLEAKGFAVTLSVNGQEALDAFLKETFQFCVFDVMMPLMDGFSLAREVRKVDKKIPILFLTAKSLKEDVHEGLLLGADDYMTKPFDMEELLLRINAIMRRSEVKLDSGKTLFHFGKFEFDFSSQTLKIGNEQQKLTSKESQLLKMLCDRANDVLDRSVALNKIWFDDNYFNARSMDVYIAKLRKYLKEDPNVELVNVHGTGFKLVVKE